MRTPQAVNDEARFFLEEGAKLYHSGEYNGYEVYEVGFPDGMPTGYPIIYLYKEGEPVLELQYEAEQFFGEDVFEIMRKAKKNARERRKAARLAKQTNLKGGE